MSHHLHLLRITLCVAINTATGCQVERKEPRPMVGPVSPATRLSQQAWLADVRALFYRAVDGDIDALRRCREQLGTLPTTNAKANAYRGACDMLDSARARLPWEKGRYASDGLRLLDGAVAAEPSDLEVRFVRGMTSYNLPELFNRSALAAQDLSKVADNAEVAVAGGVLEPALAAAALYYSGVIRSRAGDPSAAAALWRRAVALAPETPAAQRAAKRLDAP